MSNAFSKFVKSGETVAKREATPGAEYSEKSIDEIVKNKSFDIQFLRLSQLETNPLNDSFEQTGIDELKESILENGLIHNLCVIYNNDSDKYRLISGERRLHAIESMSDEERRKIFPKGIPCKVVDPSLSPDEEKLMLMAANIDTRNLTPLQRSETVKLINQILMKKKENGEKVSLRKEVSETFGVTDRMAGKYINVAKNLSEGLMELHSGGKVTLTEADKYSMLSEEAQDVVLKSIQETGETLTKEEYETLKQKDQEKANALKGLNEQMEKRRTEAEKAEKEIAEAQVAISESEESKKILKAAGVETDDVSNDIKTIQKQLQKKQRELDRAEKEKERLAAEAEEKKSLSITLTPDEKLAAEKAQNFSKTLDRMTSDVKNLTKLKKYVPLDANMKKKIADIISILNATVNSEK